MNFSVSNSYVYGLERAVKASGNPMRVVIDTSEANDKDFLRAEKLGSCHNGEGHVDFMIGTADLEIVGTSADGKETILFHNGT